MVPLNLRREEIRGDTRTGSASGASFCALTYRIAADLLKQVFPVDAAKHPETLRRHTLKIGEALAECAAIQPETPAAAIVVTLDFDLHPQL